ncbi:MAG: hypothetical protein IJJ28_07495 [Lentisphaeria bacterium]|nr:hypothetical protein [Lentisphaeria bacterium]
MDRVIFLNSSGGIVTYPGQIRSGVYIPAYNIAPYIEPVAFPVVSVDPAALYGDRPEHLATLTHSRGAALTFFVDSVAGGGDTSGNGSYDHPWRSLNTASAFLQCAGCVLNAAAKYVQIKVKGTVDYLSGTWGWNIYSWLRPKLILTGWDGRCDLGAGHFYVGNFFNVRVSAGAGLTGGVFSNCEVLRAGSSGVALDCALPDDYADVSVAYNCSGSGATSARILYGGRYVGGASATYAYGATVSRVVTSTYINYNTALFVGSGAVSMTVSAVGSATAGHANAEGIRASSGAYLAGCDVTATAWASGEPDNGPVVAYAVGSAGGAIVSGGRVVASAYASGVNSTGASAVAEAVGLGSGTTATGATVIIDATAAAHITRPNGQETEVERTSNLGLNCVLSTVRYYSGGVVTSTYTASSGGLCQ